MRDKILCASCKFNRTCKEYMKKIFASSFNFKTKRRGASLLSLMVFFFAALVITAQVFFFSKNSAESVREDRDIQSVRMQLASVVEDLKILIRKGETLKTYSYPGTLPQRPDGLSFFNLSNVQVSCDNFYEATRASLPKQTNITGIDPPINFDGIHDTISMAVHDLNYNYDATTWIDKPVNERIFPPMKDHYLIRVHKAMPAGNRFMIQALVESSDTVLQTKTYEEIWWDAE